jgi:hypothetical protein
VCLFVPAHSVARWARRCDKRDGVDAWHERAALRLRAIALDSMRLEGYGSAMMARARDRSIARAGSAFIGLAMVIGVACGGSAVSTQTPEAERTALVAQPCLGLAVGSGPLDPTKVRVFVEVAEVSTRELPEPIGHWLDENAVKVRGAANLVAFPNVATSMPWGPCVDAVCSSTRLTLTLTAQLPERASDPIELALRIAESAPANPEAEPRVLLDSTLRVVDQTPFVLPPAPDVSAGSVIVTPYLLQRHDDLQRVMECKVHQNERERQLR